MYKWLLIFVNVFVYKDHRCQNGWLNHVQKQTFERGTHNGAHTCFAVLCFGFDSDVCCSPYVFHFPFRCYLVRHFIRWKIQTRLYVPFYTVFGVRVLVDKIKTKGVWTVRRSSFHRFTVYHSSRSLLPFTCILLCEQVPNEGFFFKMVSPLLWFI